MTQPQREGFEVMAELVREAWEKTARHASTAIAEGPGALLPAITVPQAQIDLQYYIRQAFHAGAAFQLSLNPFPSLIMIETPGDKVAGKDQS